MLHTCNTRGHLYIAFARTTGIVDSAHVTLSGVVRSTSESMSNSGSAVRTHALINEDLIEAVYHIHVSTRENRKRECQWDCLVPPYTRVVQSELESFSVQVGDNKGEHEHNLDIAKVAV